MATIRELFGVLGDARGGQQRAALDALAGREPRQVLMAAADCFQVKNRNSTQKANVCALLTRMPGRESLTLLIRVLLDDTSPVVRRAAMAALLMTWLGHDGFSADFDHVVSRLHVSRQQKLNQLFGHLGKELPLEFQSAVRVFDSVRAPRSQQEAVRKRMRDLIVRQRTEYFREGGRTFAGRAFYVDIHGTVHMYD